MEPRAGARAKRTWFARFAIAAFVEWATAFVEWATAFASAI